MGGGTLRQQLPAQQCHTIIKQRIKNSNRMNKHPQNIDETFSYSSHHTIDKHGRGDAPFGRLGYHLEWECDDDRGYKYARGLDGSS
jgi:hypothetical protein